MIRSTKTLLQPHERKVIEAFQETVQARYAKQIVQLMLFGSKARGDSQPESDIDILLIVHDNDWQFRHAISDIASDVSLEHGVLLGPRVIDQQQWQRMQRGRVGLCENIAREGIPLFPATT